MTSTPAMDEHFEFSPGRTWETPQPFYDRALAVSALTCLGDAGPSTSRQLGGFAELSGCVRAMSTLASAQEAARTAINNATAVAIASLLGEGESFVARVPALGTSDNVDTCVFPASSSLEFSPPSVCVGADVLADATPTAEASLEPCKADRAQYAHVGTSQAAASSSSADKPAAGGFQASEPVSPRTNSVRSARSTGDQCLSEHTKPSLPLDTKPKLHSGIFSHNGVWIAPGMAKRRMRGHCVNVTTGDHMWSDQIHGSLPQGAAGHDGVVDVLKCLPSPRVVAPCKPFVKASDGALLTETREEHGMVITSATGITPSSSSACTASRATDAQSYMCGESEVVPNCEGLIPTGFFRAQSGLFQQQEELKIFGKELKVSPSQPIAGRREWVKDGDAENSSLPCLNSRGNHCKSNVEPLAHSSIDVSDDVATTVDTDVPSERSFALHADASLVSLLSLDSHLSSATHVSRGTLAVIDDKSVPSAGVADSGCSLLDAGGAADNSEVWAPSYPAPEQIDGVFAPLQPREPLPPQRPAQVPLSVLRACYGGRVPRPSSRQRATTPRKLQSLGSARAARSLGPLKAPTSALHSEARFEKRHIAALAAQGTSEDSAEHRSEGIDQRANHGKAVGAAVAMQNVKADCIEHNPTDSVELVPPFSFAETVDMARSFTPHVAGEQSSHRRTSHCRLGSKSGTAVSSRRESAARQMSRLHMPKSEMPPPPLIPPRCVANTICPFSHTFIEEGIVLKCGHRFEHEHLGTAISNSHRMSVAPAGFLVCPMCGSVQRYGPSPDDKHFPSSSCAKSGPTQYPTIYSVRQRAFHGPVHTRNWNVETTLPANV